MHFGNHKHGEMYVQLKYILITLNMKSWLTTRCFCLSHSRNLSLLGLEIQYSIGSLLDSVIDQFIPSKLHCGLAQSCWKVGTFKN